MTKLLAILFLWTGLVFAQSDVMSSVSDLTSLAPADLFSDVSTDTGNDSIDVDASTPVDEQSTEVDNEIDVPESMEEPAEESAEEVDADAVPAEEPEPGKEPPKEQEELPEGVQRGKDRNGKEGLFVEPNRWKTIYSNHQLVQQASQIVGEPITQALVQDMHERVNDGYDLHDKITSGDPTAQGDVLGQMFDEMARQRNEGETNVDAAVPFAQQFYEQVLSKSPAAYEALMYKAAGDLLTDMYQRGAADSAAGRGDALFNSAQFIVKALTGGTDADSVASIAKRLGLPFYKKAEIPSIVNNVATAQTDTLARENALLRQKLEGREAETATAQFDRWYSETRSAVNDGVLNNAIKPAIAHVEEAWKKVAPDTYQKEVVEPLHSAINKELSKDKTFGDTINRLHNQAKRAVSAQARANFASEITRVYTQRAKLAAESVKGPILKEAASRLKWQASQNHARLKNGQNRSAVKGATGPAPSPILPKGMPEMGDTFDPKVAQRQMMSLFNS